MSPVFADTAYFIALLNPVDQHHSRAVELTRQPRNPMVTTTWVLSEVLTTDHHFTQAGFRVLMRP